MIVDLIVNALAVAQVFELKVCRVDEVDGTSLAWIVPEEHIHYVVKSFL